MDITDMAITDPLDREGQMWDILQVIGAMPSLLLSSGDNCDAAIDESLIRIGQLFAASRAYVMLNERNGRYLRNTHEWVNTAAGSQIFPWPLYDCEYDVPSLKEIITRHKVFFGHSRDMPQDLGHVMSKQGVQSFVISPIVQEHKYVGIVGMDFCDEECCFSDDSAMVLQYFPLGSPWRWSGKSISPCEPRPERSAKSSRISNRCRNRG